MATGLKLGYNTGYWSAGPPAGVLEAIRAVSYTHLTLPTNSRV